MAMKHRRDIVRLLLAPLMLVISIPFLLTLLPAIEATYMDAVIGILVFSVGWFVPEVGPSLAGPIGETSLLPLAIVSFILVLVIAGLLFTIVNRNSSRLWLRSLNSIIWAILILEGIGALVLVVIALIIQGMGDPV